MRRRPWASVAIHGRSRPPSITSGGRSVIRGVALYLALFAGAQWLDRIVAVVDGAPITQSDVAAAMQLGLVPRAPGDPVSAAIDALVERRPMLEGVARYAPPPPPGAG